MLQSCKIRLTSVTKSAAQLETAYIFDMWELLSTESDNEENSEESENKSWCVKWFLSMRAQLSLKSQDKGKAKWAVTVIVLIVILFLGLVLISTVREIEKRKDVEGYPAWEEVLNQVKRIEANHSELVSVQTIGRWALTEDWVKFYLQNAPKNDAYKKL